MNGRPWNAQDLEVLRREFPHVASAAVAETLRRSLSSVNNTAYKLGIHKTPEYLASPAACRLRRGDGAGAATRFQKGAVPHNKGLRRPGWAPGRMRETQFRPGERAGIAAKNWRPVGTILPDAEGYLRIKVREAVPCEAYGFGNVRVWPLLHRHNWRQVKGEIPAGHALVFRDGNRANCDVDNLELLSRGDLMRRNTIHNLPKELVEVIQLTGAIKRKVRERYAAEQAI